MTSNQDLKWSAIECWLPYFVLTGGFIANDKRDLFILLDCRPQRAFSVRQKATQRIPRRCQIHVVAVR